MTAPLGNQIQLLAFESAGQRMVLDVMRIREVVGAMPLMPVPASPYGVIGQMILRGQVLSVLSLSQCLQMHSAPDGPKMEGGQEPVTLPHHILVVEAAGHTFGLGVDRVLEVLRVAPRTLKPDKAPPSMRSPLFFGVCKIGEKTYLMLDVRPLVTTHIPK